MRRSEVEHSLVWIGHISTGCVHYLYDGGRSQTYYPPRLYIIPVLTGNAKCTDRFWQVCCRCYTKIHSQKVYWQTTFSGGKRGLPPEWAIARSGLNSHSLSPVPLLPPGTTRRKKSLCKDCRWHSRRALICVIQQNSPKMITMLKWVALCSSFGWRLTSFHQSKNPPYWYSTMPPITPNWLRRVDVLTLQQRKMTSWEDSGTATFPSHLVPHAVSCFSSVGRITQSHSTK